MIPTVDTKLIDGMVETPRESTFGAQELKDELRKKALVNELSQLEIGCDDDGDMSPNPSFGDGLIKMDSMKSNESFEDRLDNNANYSRLLK